MIQRIIAGGWFAFNKDNTSYTSPHGGLAWTAITPNFPSFLIIPVAGTLRKFRVRVRGFDGTPAAPAAGESYTLTVRKNEAPTDLQVVVDENDYDATDLSNEVEVTAGNRIDIRCVPGGSPLNDRYPLWSFEFEPTNIKESIYPVTGGVWFKNQAIGYFTFTPDASNPFDNTQAEVQQIIATAGNIKSLYLQLSDNPGTGTDAYTMTLMLNGAPTALTVSIAGGAGSGFDVVNEVAVVAGDLVCWKKEVIDTPTNNVTVRAGFAFEATTDSESLFLNGYKTALNTGAARYYALSHNLRAWNVNEYEQYQYGQETVISKFYVRVSAAPGGGKSWTFKIRKNGVDTGIVVTIADGATTGNDTTNDIEVSNDDYLDVEVTPSGTPATAAAYWGARQVTPDPIAPTVTTQAMTDIDGSTATGNGNIIDLGEPTATQHGHCWKIRVDENTTPPTTSDSKTENGVPSATGIFTSSVTGLTMATPYLIRAYATNDTGIGYGEQVTFLAGAPTAGDRAGPIRIVEDRLHYVDAYGVERWLKGTIV